MGETLRLGSRKSTLAMAQARQVADALGACGRTTELVGVTTYGDETSLALSRIGGQGVFVSVLRERLLAGDIDVAVHSLKDLPTAAAPGLTVAAVPAREDPYDALVAREGVTLAGLAGGARVGTGSLRRAAQVRALRPDLDVVPIRGNVDTRLGKVATGEVDAVVLAAAGLVRLGRAEEISEILDPATIVPSAGQGALAVECREEHLGLATLLAELDDPAARAAVTAERRVLSMLEAGCSAPVGAYARCGSHTSEAGEAGREQSLHLRAVVTAVDGDTAVRGEQRGSMAEAEEVGKRLGDDLVARGATALTAATGAGRSGGESESG